MPAEHLRQPSPRRIIDSNPLDAATAIKETAAKRFSAHSESDAETTISLTSSEGSPMSDQRSAAQMREQRSSRTSITATPTNPARTGPAAPSRPAASSKVVSNIRPIKERVPTSRIAKASAAQSRVAAKRTSAASKRSSDGWDTLTRKSSTFRNTSSASATFRSSINKGAAAAAAAGHASHASHASHAGAAAASQTKTAAPPTASKPTPKDELIAKLQKQVEMLQQKQQKTDASHHKTTQNLEGRLEDLRMGDSILIDQLRTERNDLKEKLADATDRLQSIDEQQEQEHQKALFAQRTLEQQLARAQLQIRKLETQQHQHRNGAPNSPSSNKIHELKERRRMLESQIAAPQSPQGSEDSDNEKIQQLRHKRQSTEQHLKTLVRESKGPTDIDMEAVIKNLRDELAASKQVIGQQKEQLKLVLEAKSNDNSAATSASATTSADASKDAGTWKAKFLELQDRHFQLQYDRAWGEFQLRNRITADSLKFNRRLQHWKEQVQYLEGKMDTLQKLRGRSNPSLDAKNAVTSHDGVQTLAKPAPPPPSQRGWWGFR